MSATSATHQVWVKSIDERPIRISPESEPTQVEFVEWDQGPKSFERHCLSCFLVKNVANFDGPYCSDCS